MSSVFIRQALYEFKQRYGVDISLQKKLSTETDLASGVKTVDYNGLRFTAIQLPDQLHREFTGDRAFRYDTSERRLIIDNEDLPDNYIINNNSWIVYDNKRWDVKSSNKFLHNSAYYILIKEVEGSIKNELFAENIEPDILIITDEVTYGL